MSSLSCASSSPAETVETFTLESPPFSQPEYSTSCIMSSSSEVIQSIPSFSSSCYSSATNPSIETIFSSSSCYSTAAPSIESVPQMTSIQTYSHPYRTRRHRSTSSCSSAEQTIATVPSEMETSASTCLSSSETSAAYW
jgi:hypothetical protein